MKKSEKGQIIIILAVSLVAILGVTALAVDGSMIYRERREDQTTADSVALAAAAEAAKSTTCEVARVAGLNKAISYASTQESVTLANDSTSPNRVEAVCSTDGKTLDIKVRVTSDTPTTFAKMVSQNQMTTTVESTARVTIQAGVYAEGSALWSTGPTCDANGGIWLSGTAIILIRGGGAYSKSCISVESSPSGIISDSAPILYSGTTGTNVTTVDVNGQIEYLGVAGELGSNGLMLANWQNAYALIEPTLTLPTAYGYQIYADKKVQKPNLAIPKAVWPIPIPIADTPTFADPMVKQACSGMTDYGTPGPSVVTYNPGLYTSISPGSVDITLNPGVYCIKPGGSVNFTQNTVTANNTVIYFQGAGSMNVTNGIKTVWMNNSSIYLTNGDFMVDQGTFSAQHITIYIKQGNFWLKNGAYGATMVAPDCDDSSCGVGPSIKGVLVYMDPANTGTFNIMNGNGTHHLTGTIYAPNALAVFDGGTSTNTMDIQLIAKRIALSGSASIIMDTDNGDLYSGKGSTSIELLK